MSSFALHEKLKMNGYNINKNNNNKGKEEEKRNVLFNKYDDAHTFQKFFIRLRK